MFLSRPSSGASESLNSLGALISIHLLIIPKFFFLMMVFKGYYFNIFMMYEVPFKNALFNKTVIAQVRPKFVSGRVWATLGL